MLSSTLFSTPFSHTILPLSILFTPRHTLSSSCSFSHPLHLNHSQHTGHRDELDITKLQYNLEPFNNPRNQEIFDSYSMFISYLFKRMKRLQWRGSLSMMHTVIRFSFFFLTTRKCSYCFVCNMTNDTWLT